MNTKNAIRKEILKKRKNLDEKVWREKSIKIQEKIIESDFYKNLPSILVYCHFDREVMTDIILQDALKRGKIVCVPFNDWEKQILIPSRIYSMDEIDRAKKIPEPFRINSIDSKDIKLAVIPGVAFDIYGNRIGMGKGFFDRFLGAASNNIFKVSPAFDFQVIEEAIPVDEWDQKVDIIITETRVIKRG